MKHRHLNHEDFTFAAIEDILEQGSIPDWVPLLNAIEADPYGAIAAAKTLHIVRYAISTDHQSCSAI